MTNWKYWVMRKMKPKRVKKATEMDSAPPVKRGIRKTRTSRSGPSVRNSISVNTVEQDGGDGETAQRPATTPSPTAGPR